MIRITSTLGCLLLLLLAPAWAEFSASQSVEQREELVLDNGTLRLVFGKQDGDLLSVTNLATRMSLFPEGPAGCKLPAVYLIEAHPPRVLSFAFEVLQDDDAGEVLKLTWEQTDGITLTIRVELMQGSPQAAFWPHVRNEGERAVRGLTFPDIPRLNTPATEPLENVLVHGFLRGMKVLDPAHSLDVPINPMGSAYYPQAYTGMTHQLVDYYAEGVGGFYFACFDPHGTEKRVDLPLRQGNMGLSWTYSSWNETEGGGLNFDFPFILGANTSGDWYDAADQYRAWAITTPWCTRRGRLVDRDPQQRANWLIEDIGLATFGTSASVDQSAWFRAYHAILDGPVFHITGHDALVEEGRGGDPLDIEMALHPENRRAFEELGDPHAIFLADLKTMFLPRPMAHVVGRTTITVFPRATPEACPKDPLWQYIHARRAARTLESTGADSFYCDASAPNRNLACYSEVHGHPPGRGRWMLDGFREMDTRTREAISTSCGEYTPLGVELMHEGLLDVFDYYQARNGGGFMGGLEGGFYRGLQLRGVAEPLPVFAYIYHDYSPVLLDGSGKATKKIGDVFYWMAARVALAGGIFELNNEFAPPERFEGMTRVGMLHYLRFNRFEWIEPGQRGNDAYDELKGEFLREIAAARTDYGTEFLAYGQMLPPLDLGGELLALDFVYGNNIDWGGKPNSIQFANQKGKKWVKRVQHQAWQFEDRLGFFFVNLGTENIELDLDLNLERYRKRGLGTGPVQLELRWRTGSKAVTWTPGEPLRLNLPSRRVILLEVRPAD